MGKLPSELEEIPAYHLSEWEAFERVFGPLTVQERMDWAAAEIVVMLAGEKNVKKGLLDWDRQIPDKAEEATAMNLEAMLKRSVED